MVKPLKIQSLWHHQKMVSFSWFRGSVHDHYQKRRFLPSFFMWRGMIWTCEEACSERKKRWTRVHRFCETKFFELMSCKDSPLWVSVANNHVTSNYIIKKRIKIILFYKFFLHIYQKKLLFLFFIVKIIKRGLICQN